MALLLTRDCNKELLERLPEPKDVWAHFLFLTETPRVPGKLDRIREKLVNLGNSLPGCEAATDGIGNVVVRKAASKGFEDAPSVALQCHMDMVCSANQGTVFDFDNDPINCYIDGEWLKARGTTLGSDNGMGVASCLAILSDPDAKHGPLECLFTADEETTMAGAEFLEGPPFLKSRIMINVDSEEEGAICVGCAGGFEVRIALPLVREALDPARYARVKLSLQGLFGGHTGIDIHKCRGNAIGLMARLLHAWEGGDLRLVDIEGGTAVNSIPRECFAEVFVEKDRLKDFQENANAHLDIYKRELAATAPDVTIAFDVAGAEGDTSSACSSDSTKKALDLMLTMLDGPLRANPFALNEMESSISFSIVKVQGDALLVHPFARSSSETQMAFTLQRLRAIARLAGAEITDKENYFPGWNPDMRSRALNVVKQASVEVLGTESRVYSVHAGLECGWIVGKYPDMDCVSIGPDIRDAHTPDEKCNIASVAKFHRLLQRCLELLGGAK